MPSDGTDRDGWSAQSVILPYIEQNNISFTLNYTLTFDNASNTLVTLADGSTAPVTSLRIPTFMCPSEKLDTAKLKNGAAAQYPLNYAVNLGTWFVWDPTSGTGGNGTFYPGSQIRAGDIADGLSYTLACAEVKAFQPMFRNAGLSSPVAVPTSPASVAAMGGTFQVNNGHTEWEDGRSTDSGFTTTFAPIRSCSPRSTASITTATGPTSWRASLRPCRPIRRSRRGAITTAASTHRAWTDRCVGMPTRSTWAYGRRLHRAGGELLPSKY